MVIMALKSSCYFRTIPPALLSKKTGLKVIVHHNNSEMGHKWRTSDSVAYVFFPVTFGRLQLVKSFCESVGVEAGNRVIGKQETDTSFKGEDFIH